MPPQEPQGPQAFQGPTQPQPQVDQPTVSVVVPQRRWPGSMSRRSILRGAAGAGAVGLAAAAGAGGAVALTRPAESAAFTNVAKPAVMAAMPTNVMEGPLVVYVSDTTTGQLDVFAGEGQTRLRNPALVRQLLQALK